MPTRPTNLCENWVKNEEISQRILWVIRTSDGRVARKAADYQEICLTLSKQSWQIQDLWQNLEELNKNSIKKLENSTQATKEWSNLFLSKVDFRAAQKSFVETQNKDWSEQWKP